MSRGRESEKKARLETQRIMLMNQPGAMVILDAENDYRIVEANPEYLKMFCLEETDLGVDVPISNYIREEDRPSFYAYLKNNRCKGKEPHKTIEFRMEMKDGTCRWFEAAVHETEDRSDVGFGFAYMALYDIDERKKLEEGLLIEMERYKLVKDLTGEYIVEYIVESDLFLLPTDIKLRKGLPDCADTEGVSSEVFKTLVHPNEWPIIERDIRHHSSKNDTGSFEYRVNQAKEGKTARYQWFKCSFKKIYGNDGKILRVICRNVDIEKERRKTSSLENKTRLDPLTNLFNKTVTEREISKFFSKGPSGSHALIMVDLDNFKQVNDNFGHLYGDVILKEISGKIKNRFRGTDVVGRIGGDEFLVLMKNATAELAFQAADDLFKETVTNINTENGAIETSCSIGIAIYPDQGLEYAELFKKAERAMYAAKDGSVGMPKLYGNDITGPEIRHKKTGRGHRRNLGTNLDQQFMNMCFDMLSESSDLGAAIDLLLEYVGKKYSLQSVAVFRFNDERDRTTRTNKWSSDTGIFTIPSRVFPDFDNREFINSFDYNDGRLIIDDVSKTDLVSKKEVEILLEDGILSIAYVRFTQSKQLEGCLAFQSIGVSRHWKPSEVSFFTEFSKIIGVFLALTDKRESDARTITTLKKRDQLTGMLNEEAFEQRVESYVRANPDVEKYVVSLDISGFAYINENFGTKAGNELLQQFGRIFDYKRSNVITCRQFSDFFLGFVGNASLKAVIQTLIVLEKEFLEKIKDSFPNSGIRLSIGIYEWSEDVSLRQAIENSSMARKNTKHQGNGSFAIYDSSMREKKTRDRMVSSRFHQALQNKEFLLYVQPKFDLKTREIVGAESLCRWGMEGGKILPPSEFVDSLERIGYITDLDFYIFEKTLIAMREWKERGYNLVPMSANFSRKHFAGEGIFRRVKAMVEDYGINPSLVEIELTESILADRPEDILKEMEDLREYGFRVDIDDFGTGFSSLGILFNMPVDVVKIDKSFLHNDAENGLEVKRRFMTHLSELMQSSNDEVVVEGVETEEQVEFLLSCGFKIGQGYICDRPIPYQNFAEKHLKKRG